MRLLIIWLTIFIVIYLLYLFFVILRKKKMLNFGNNVYVTYLIKMNKLDKKKLNMTSVAHIVSLANAFIIATTFVIVINIKNFMLMLLVAVVILIPLLLLVYYLIGLYLKKGGNKNV